MSNNPYKPIAGQTFKEGPYEYRIYVKTGDIGDDSIISISIFLENIPDVVGMDLVQLAMRHVSELTPADMIASTQFMINKIVMEEYESIGEISRALVAGVTLGLQPLNSLIQVIEKNLDKKIDFQEINRVIGIRAKKADKTISFLAHHLKEVNGTKIIITGKTTGTPKKDRDGKILPAISVNLEVMASGSKNSWDMNNKIKEAFAHVCPMDLDNTDNISISYV